VVSTKIQLKGLCPRLKDLICNSPDSWSILEGSLHPPQICLNNYVSIASALALSRCFCRNTKWRTVTSRQTRPSIHTGAPPSSSRSFYRRIEEGSQLEENHGEKRVWGTNC